MLRQLGHRKGVRLHSRIVDVDLKNNARGRRARFDLGRELLCTAQHDPAVDRLPTGSIAPPEFPHFLSISAVGFFAPACALCKPGGNCISPGVSIVWTMLVFTEASMVTAFQRQQSSARLSSTCVCISAHTLAHRQAMAPATAALAGRS